MKKDLNSLNILITYDKDFSYCRILLDETAKGLKWLGG